MTKPLETKAGVRRDGDGVKPRRSDGEAETLQLRTELRVVNVERRLRLIRLRPVSVRGRLRHWWSNEWRAKLTVRLVRRDQCLDAAKQAQEGRQRMTKPLKPAQEDMAERDIPKRSPLNADTGAEHGQQAKYQEQSAEDDRHDACCAQCRLNWRADHAVRFRYMPSTNASTAPTALPAI